MLIIILKLTFVLDYRNSIAETYIVSELGNSLPVFARAIILVDR